MHKSMLTLPLLVVAACGRAEDIRVDRIDVLEKGIYAIETGGETQDPGTPTGAITAVTAVENLESTSTVPARLGVEFGFRFVVVGEPSGAEVTLDVVNTYPEPGLRQPGGGQALHRSEYRRTKTIGETEYLGYGFENAWEAVPGTWTFEIRYENRKLVEESFTVVE